MIRYTLRWFDDGHTEAGTEDELRRLFSSTNLFDADVGPWTIWRDEPHPIEERPALRLADIGPGEVWTCEHLSARRASPAYPRPTLTVAGYTATWRTDR